MAKKVIVFFTCEPGGAEVLIPVIDLVVKKTYHKVIVLGYGLAADRFVHKGVNYIEVGRIEKNDLAIMNIYRPDLIISSAASLPERDMSEKYLWHNALMSAIPCIAFLDQWQNYVARFSGPNLNERLAFLPKYINCINDVGEREMVLDGFDSRALKKFGQPYLSSLKSDAKFVDINKAKKKLGIESEQRVALFASEAILQHYGRLRGYDQYDALRVFLELISKFSPEMLGLIKLHPKDELNGYKEILSDYPGLRLIVIKNEISPLESILIADEVYGMTSIMLIEAYILSKKVVSLQPGLIGEDSCVLSRYNIIPLILSKNDIYSIQRPSLINYEFDYEFQKIAFLRFIDSLLYNKNNHK